MRRFLHALRDALSCRGAYERGRRAGIQLGVARLCEAAERIDEILPRFGDGLDGDDVVYELRELEEDLLSVAMRLDREVRP